MQPLVTGWLLGSNDSDYSMQSMQNRPQEGMIVLHPSHSRIAFGQVRSCVGVPLITNASHWEHLAIRAPDSPSLYASSNPNACSDATVCLAMAQSITITRL